MARRHARAEYEAYAGTRAALQERARSQRAWMVNRRIEAAGTVNLV